MEEIVFGEVLVDELEECLAYISFQCLVKLSSSTQSHPLYLAKSLRSRDTTIYVCWVLDCRHTYRTGLGSASLHFDEYRREPTETRCVRCVLALLVHVVTVCYPDILCSQLIVLYSLL